MEKKRTYTEIYRLPPTKKFPKGLRVRKAVRQDYPDSGVSVAAVRDGHMFYTRQPLTRE